MAASPPPPPPPPPPTHTHTHERWKSAIKITVIHRSSSAIGHFVVDENFTSFFGYQNKYIKVIGISELRLSTFKMVHWVEGPLFVDSCGIFWTKLCDSRCILPNVLHFYLPRFLANCLQNARNAV